MRRLLDKGYKNFDRNKALVRENYVKDMIIESVNIISALLEKEEKER